MALPLIALYALVGASSYVSSAKVEEAAAKNGMVPPDWSKALGGVGLLGMLFGGPILAAVGTGVALGSLEAHRTATTVREGIAGYLDAKMKAAAQPTIPQLPGAATPPINPAAQPSASLWSLPGRLLDGMFSTTPTPTPTGV